MMVIVDSGSTKAHWCLIDKNGEKLIQTIGINPYQMNNEAIQEVLKNELHPFLNGDLISHVHFYGAGCSTDQKCSLLDSVLQDFFKTASIEVHHDLLGAARALCGHEKGVACILGTGCNSGYYDGENIKDQIHSLGYVLGDEGSGAYIGKLLIRDYYQGAMPYEVQQLFIREFDPVLGNILDKVYNQPQPNRYLASFCPFISENINHPYLYDLVSSSFDEFFQKHVLKFEEAKNSKIHFMGSIAYYFSDILKESAHKAGLQIGKIYESPVKGLVDYHTIINQR